MTAARPSSQARPMAVTLVPLKRGGTRVKGAYMRTSHRHIRLALLILMTASLVVALAVPTLASTSLGAWAWGGGSFEPGNGTIGDFPVPVLIGTPGNASFTSISVGG